MAYCLKLVGVGIELFSLLSPGVLAGLVLIGTFLSWALVLEIEGRWPRQRDLSQRFGVNRKGTN